MNNQDYNIEFVEPPPYDCNCPICLEMFKDKVCYQTKCCGNHICSECATRLKKMETPCAVCRSGNFDVTEDQFFTRQFLNLKVRCYYSNVGCKWTGELRQLDEHEKKCTKNVVKCQYCNENHCGDNEHLLTCRKANAIVTCPNRCSNPKQKRDTIKAHLENECPLRVIIAPNGALPITANGETSIVPVSFTMLDYLKHLESGQPWYSPPFYTRESGYKLSIRVDAKLNEESNHLSIHACVLKGEYDDQLQWPIHAEVRVSLLNWKGITKSLYLPGDEYCKHVLVDEITPLGKGITEFISNEDLELILNKNMQELSCKCLSFRVENIRKLPMPQVIPDWAKNNCMNYFAINSFKRMKKDERNEFFGSSFYTHKNEYKIELSVKFLPNGKTGTDVYVTARVVEREHGNNSVWPFCGEFGIDLINWRNDKNHKHIKITFDEYNQSDVVQSSFGILRFEEYSQLTYNSATDTEYLHNDCLLFKVAIACTHQFTLDKFTTRKLSKNVYYSKPFFAISYKMQISVEANANGYIGVYAHLMKGPNDNKLIWPFCGDVVVELVNWIEDNDHHRQVIELSPEVVTNNVCDRVLVGDRRKGWRTKQFIQHSSIKPQFLQDDCLYFRVKEVVVHSNELSLKTPKWQNPQSLSPLFEFTVTNVSKRKEHNTTFYSPAFHSHNEGYKLQLEVERSSDQQHISIFARLLRGQHDDNLVWPFQASIVVELVNWREDANHHSYTISFNEHTPIKCKSQVTEGEWAPKGRGTHTFISYSSLDSTNTKYLQDDCLRFRVKEIVIYSTPHCVKKPAWLEEAANSFTITRFSDRIHLQDIYWSPPFYTSARGYRMCLKVYPAGAGISKGTHISIYGYLMKGDYDDELNWPFTADVVVDILNWRRDKRYFRVVLRNVPHERVYGNEMKCVWNNSNALAVQTLSSASSDSQYLSEDCMCIRVHDVVINSNQLLNKTPCWNQSSNSALEFTLNRFTLRSSYDNHYCNKPFFASGYKMQISIAANVNGYIGVYAHLMKGPNDDKLIWPFCGDVVIELVNWIKDNDHHRQVLELSPERVTNNVCDRVLVGDKSVGRGTSLFIQHSFIKPQFLQDDCLYFRVKEVVIHSNELSLKTPKWQNPQSLSPLIEFTVTNVSKRKEHNTTFYSPAFHSHNEGYKLRLEVQRSPDQQHISIYARLLRGQHDDNLVWPFQASIVVELVNWREDTNHHLYTISFNERTPNNCKSQVTEEEWAPSGCGTGTFISYSSLDKRNTEYLQDDCLRFRVKEIVVYSTTHCVKKPLWLKKAANSFTITHFSDRIRLQDIYWSPPFYTCARGYRMCLNVFPAGNGTGKGTHVSICGFLMKGDYDNELNWPFTADMLVDILNWRRDKNHHRVVLQNESHERVYGNEMKYVWNNSNALAVQTLSSSSDPQYLSEDCMCIRVHDVVINSNQLLNKTPCWNQSSTSALEFTLNRFTLRSSYDNHYYSKPFFASGYKMQISIAANVNGYICVYAHLMKGPNDDKLIWPFCGDVVVELVNWIEDNDHHRQVIELSRERITNNVCDRVLVGDKSVGWGKSQFIQHSAIKPQFLQDDCLYFRVKEVVVHSNELSLNTPKWQNPQSLSPLIEFTVTNVSKRKKHDTIFYSPAFHSYNEGYKLRLKVERSSDQQHISIFARLLRGQHDDNLVWPFQSSIVVELVNWREDANHHSYTISFNEHTPNECKSQVTEGEQANGLGTHTFISYSSLDSTNTEYLQDDCLRFRVKEIVVYSTPLCMKKPVWLKETANLFTITCFSDRIRLKNIYWSPPFYTSARGYKLCLKVCPAGYGTCKSTHVSIYGYLLKGDYDDKLNWPFTADVVVDILNWRGDNNHHRVVLQNGSHERVYGNEMKCVWAKSNALAVQELSSSSSDPQYLSEDCMCIRIYDVIINSNQLLNKTPCWNQSSNSALEFTLDKFTLRSSYENRYFSKPFFTSGYKMQICVKANVNGYIGVYAHLMKGSNDDKLIWPFCGDVVVELVNWIEDNDHHRQVIQLSPEVVTGNACDRVLVGDRSVGWGKSQFIQHSAIKPQFLQDDCLYFRVKEVVVHSNELSLKTPKWQNPQSLSPFIDFTVTNVSKRKEHNTTSYSPAFHSHNEGYKLRLHGVQRSPDQQHISIYARLLRGQHDDNLVWPFQASIVVELVNWKEDANHHSYTISFNECTPIKCKSQVTEGEQAPIGWGTHTFISYSSLDKRNTEYLQDDCLRFRVKEIVVYSTTHCVKKPLWLKKAANSFTITHFSDRIRLQDIYWSPPFYTCARGYRMCLNVFPAGNGTGKGTHVSICGFLMKGDYDNELNWPFTADMLVDILNWRRDKNHHRVVLQNESHERVYGNEMKYVWNNSNALAVQTLSSSSDPQYLSEDCMCIRVHDVVINSNQLLNKTPCWNQSSTSALEFTLNRFTLRSSYDNHYYSKPFFASGYKMQISIAANVNGYICVYAHLMKGPNDDKLIWPFCGDVVVELVNWIEDNDHHRQVIELSRERITNNVCDRVLVGDKSVGWGKSQFIQHSAIKPQFLQDDCLYFRVKEVVVHSNELSLNTPKWQNPQSLSPLIEFTVTNVSKRKKHDTIFYSPAFHSYNEGYKLRLKVERSSDQQHISIFARLLRGQHDDNLVWPFQSSIVVELVNWREDANHHSYTISFNEHTPNECKSQVTEGEWAPNGLGTHTFISYSSLDSTNTEYLQDDCLRFRVKEIVVYSTPLCMKKPVWLKETANLFTITCFSDRIRLKNIYWSPPFYTSARGYRMCLRVYPTGYGPEGTSVYMFGYLIKGDYDDELNWPFTADVVIDILNWRGDYNHHRVVIKFKNAARVHDDNKVGLNSYGNATEKRTSSGTQYLSEDCMCIRIHDVINAAPLWWHKSSVWQTEFKITGVSKHLKYNTSYISTPFYTHKKGYKMRLEVYPNGLGDEVGTHVSIYFCLLKGEYDNDLAWPINIKMKVKILNWCKNDNHITEICSIFDSRITDSNKTTVSGELPQFCTHSTLLTASEATKYIKDDCMRVCLSQYYAE